MSLRQERLKEEMWNDVHKPEFEKELERLHQLETEIGQLLEELAAKQATRDSLRESIKEFYEKFHP